MISRLFNIFSLPRCPAKDDSQKDTFEFLVEREAFNSTKLLLCGPPSCGKTSLLFELALSFAEEGKHVLFVCPRKLERLPLRVSGRACPTSQTLKFIRMVYLEERAEFLKFMASIHVATQELFHAVLVDGIDHFFGGAAKSLELSFIARVLAYTADAFAFEIKKLAEIEQSCGGILAVSIGLPGNTTGIPHHNLYERWLEYFVKINPSQKFEQQVLSLYPASCHDNKSLVDVHYRMTSEQITVVDIK